MASRIQSFKEASILLYIDGWSTKSVGIAQGRNRRSPGLPRSGSAWGFLPSWASGPTSFSYVFLKWDLSACPDWGCCQRMGSLEKLVNERWVRKDYCSKDFWRSAPFWFLGWNRLLLVSSSSLWPSWKRQNWYPYWTVQPRCTVGFWSQQFELNFAEWVLALFLWDQWGTDARQPPASWSADLRSSVRPRADADEEH